LSIAATALRRAVLESPGATSAVARRAAFDRSAQEDDLAADAAAYVSVVHEHAFRVTQAQVSALLDAGMSEDSIFELTVAAALGAAERRLEAGRALLDAGGDS
jgi:alkylhydroperoxidase family enzyme